MTTVKRDTSFWAIIEFKDGTYNPLGEIAPPLVLETNHKIIILESESEYLIKCSELGIELEEEL